MKPGTGYLGQKDRTAIVWLWRGYLRRYVAQLALIFLFVTIYGLSLVVFLALINNNFTALFAPDNGVYQFSVRAVQSQQDNQPIDENGDGIYEFALSIKQDSSAGFETATFAVVLVAPETIESAPAQSLPLIVASEQSTFSPDDIRQALQLVDAELGEVAGPDGVHVQFIRAGVEALLFDIFLILIAATVLRVTSAYASGRLAAWVVAKASFDLRRDLIRRLMSLDLIYFDSLKTGQVMIQLNDLIKRIETFFSATLFSVGRAAVTIIGILGYLFWVHPGLFLFIAMVLPLSVLGVQAIAVPPARFDK